MKFLIIACFLGFAAASFMEHAAPLVDDAVQAIVEGMNKAGPLRLALDMPDAYELDKVEEDMKTELIKNLREELNQLLERIKERIEKGKVITDSILEKVQDLSNKLRDLNVDYVIRVTDLLEKIKEIAKGKAIKIWQRIKDIFHLSGRSRRGLDHLLAEVEKTTFKDFIEDLKEKFRDNETIQKIREYIKNIVTKNPIINTFKEMLNKIQDGELIDFLKGLLGLKKGRDLRSLKEMWEKIREYFREKHIVMKEKFMKFGEWLKDVWNNALEKVKDHHERIVKIAKEVIAHFKDLSKDVLIEAREFLRPYKEDLGTLWKQIVDHINETIRQY